MLLPYWKIRCSLRYWPHLTLCTSQASFNHFSSCLLSTKIQAAFIIFEWNALFSLNSASLNSLSSTNPLILNVFMFNYFVPSKCSKVQINKLTDFFQNYCSELYLWHVWLCFLAKLIHWDLYSALWGCGNLLWAMNIDVHDQRFWSHIIRVLLKLLYFLKAEFKILLLFS